MATNRPTPTDKQKRKAEHIEEGYEKRGVPGDGAERRAWATEQGERRRQEERLRRGRPETHISSRRGGKLGGKAAAARPAAERSTSARKAAATRKHKASG